jgi:[NiFe] hydrogenase diaphorase moiety large subunit
MTDNKAKSVQKFVSECIGKQPDTSLLLQYLIAIQHQYLYIPCAAIQQLTQQLSTTEAHIKSVVDFYSFLNLESPGSYQLLFSDNITDRFSGSVGLLEQMKSALSDQNVTLGLTSCTGLCDQGPGLLVNGHAINHLDSLRADAIVQLIQQNKPVTEWPQEWFEVEDNIQRKDIQLSADYQAGEGLKAVVEGGDTQFLQQLEHSGLRGRGGAGFLTAKKWQYCKESQADMHYVICNADEGEPGTFKDRVLLNAHADAVIEGMTICAKVIGSSKGFIYLRGEYRFLLDKLNAILQQRRQQGLLGDNILGQAGFNFDIDIHLGAGAYVCGEESALIESLEGKRGNPRVKPPFPVQHGYMNKPTVVNNVETFYSVNFISAQGAEIFSQAGTEQSRGTRLLSISGDCSTPGIYEYPFGVSLHQILKDCGGENAQAVQMAGAAGNLVLARNFDRVMSFEDLATGGSFMVIGPERNLLEILNNFARFFVHESCGFCTPCRVGTSLIAEIIDDFANGNGSSTALNQLTEVSSLMLRSSFCGLGCSAPNVFADAMRDCPEIFEAQMKAGDDPAFDLEKAVSEYDQLVKTSAQEVR